LQAINLCPYKHECIKKENKFRNFIDAFLVLFSEKRYGVIIGQTKPHCFLPNHLPFEPQCFLNLSVGLTLLILPRAQKVYLYDPYDYFLQYAAINSPTVLTNCSHYQKHILSSAFYVKFFRVLLGSGGNYEFISTLHVAPHAPYESLSPSKSDFNISFYQNIVKM
jgi:hypothetical protein